MMIVIDHAFFFSTGTGLESVRVAGPDPGYWLTGDAGY